MRIFIFAAVLWLCQGAAFCADVEPVTKVKVTGGDESYNMSVVQDAGLNKAAVLATVTSDSISYFLGNSQLFSASSNVNAATSGTNNPIFLLRNPIGSGKNVTIIKIIAQTSVTNVTVLFYVFANPTVTNNGTTLTNYQRKIGSTPANGVALTTTLPTVSATGNRMDDFVYGQNNGGWNVTDPHTMMIQPGNSILLTANPASNNRDIPFTVVWIETDA